MNTFNVVIIGCGQIAGGFDQDNYNSKNNNIYTHAGAYNCDKRFNITACIDPDTSICNNFAKYWNIKHQFSNIHEFINSGIKADIISICSPTNTHYDMVKHSINLLPKLIFCEKPVGNDYIKLQELILLCKEKNILFAVNYIRRWDTTVNNIKNNIKLGIYGKIRSISCYYNKGLFNNASHMINLILFLFESKLNVLFTKKIFNDFTNEDPSYIGLLQLTNEAPVHLIAGNSLDYSIFEINFIFENGVLSMKDSGNYWNYRSKKNSNFFKNYKDLSIAKKINGHVHTAMVNATNNISEALHHHNDLLSDGSSALETLKICNLIREFDVN